MLMVLIAPSMLSADFSCLKDEVKALAMAGADWIHLDVMDGHFVENLTFGPMVIKSIRPYTNLPFDVHLMVDNPLKMIPWFVNAGADIITLHAEACKHLDRAVELIKSYGKKAGVSLNPSTPETVLEYVADKLDLVLVMSVNPGFGGQSFNPLMIEKIAKIKTMFKGKKALIEVDGGINALTAAECKAAGADVLVAGSAVFANGDYKKNIEALR
ncbi:MAG: ribulose-phosphate 3-epimerase [Alphaproteobacteria bacterium]|nr:ribulose-phosphate 3-epimerase [Alphaproteobacteria bacterium]